MKGFQPELATLVKEPPQGSGWLYEIKFDGYRLLAFIEQGKVRLVTRNGNDWTEKFLPLAKALAKLSVDSAIIDGELVALDQEGVSKFQLLQNAIAYGDKAEMAYYVFDLPYYEGEDIAHLPLTERKALLKKMVAKPPTPMIRFSDHLRGEGRELLEHACSLHLEGLIAKRKNSTYQNTRSLDWVKIKCSNRQEFVIGGFTNPAGSRQFFGSLLVGYYDDLGHLIYAGRVGTGFNQKSLGDLYQKMEKLEQKATPFYQLPRIPEVKGAHWIAPKLIAEVEFSEWTDDARVRHPSFKGLRLDKPAQEIGVEMPSKINSHTDNMIAGIKLSHPEKLFFPQAKISKWDLASYYHHYRDLILPHILNRPLAILRCPDGVGHPCFLQKHVETLPETIGRVEITEKSATTREHLVIHNEAGLIALIQHGVIEIHTWGCSADNIEKPDQMIFDLDPGPEVPWKRVIECAEILKAGLEAYGLQSFVKTSGKKGLHICLPLQRIHSWDEVKTFSHDMANRMVELAPDRFVAKITKSERKGKILIDYLRNERGATCVAAFSTRATPDANISTPLAWDELKKLKSADQYHFGNIGKRIAHLKEDPWQGYFKIKQSLNFDDS